MVQQWKAVRETSRVNETMVQPQGSDGWWWGYDWFIAVLPCSLSCIAVSPCCSLRIQIMVPLPAVHKRDLEDIKLQAAATQRPLLLQWGNPQFFVGSCLCRFSLFLSDSWKIRIEGTVLWETLKWCDLHCSLPLKTRLRAPWYPAKCWADRRQ